MGRPCGLICAAYCEVLLGIGSWTVKGVLLVAVIALQLRGANEADL
jgi:hypothetical protein